MRAPTSEQERVLRSGARIRLVRAAPGSGKTWLVAEAIRDELRAWRPGRGGMAALSFTRVGGEEIAAALGHGLPHPHFVGTIDAFLFRYVVRPHLRALDPGAKTPELLAADWLPAEIWTAAAAGCQGVNPFACVWTGRGADGEPVLSHVNKFGGATPLEPGKRAAVLAYKSKLRRDHGRITLSDSALFASRMLSHGTRGASIRAEIARRFPLLIVDELQDTGVFLSESVRALLGEPGMRGLLVGDPDQSIYEFAGASPQMFEGFGVIEGAELLDLSTTQRCPAAVTCVATHLKRSGGVLNPDPARTGRVLLLRYDDMTRDVAAVARAFRQASTSDVVKVVARSNATVDDLTGRSSTDVPSLGCRPAGLLHRAVRHFRRGRSVSALAAARTALELSALDGEGFTNDQLRARGVESSVLRDAAVRALLAADALPTTATTIEWQAAALDVLTKHALAFCALLGVNAPRKPSKPRRDKGHDRPVALSIPSRGSLETGLEGVRVTTVHGVKGETHDVTIVVAPPTSGRGGAKRCPSALWWPQGNADDEERRVAYVALTRTRRDLVLCVDGPAYDRLRALRAEFVAGFEHVSVAQLLARLETAPVVDIAVPA
jgi:DNA helicase II / ATP-dependent DNA helicase PcrA